MGSGGLLAVPQLVSAALCNNINSNPSAYPGQTCRCADEGCRQEAVRFGCQSVGMQCRGPDLQVCRSGVQARGSELWVSVSQNAVSWGQACRFVDDVCHLCGCTSQGVLKSCGQKQCSVQGQACRCADDEGAGYNQSCASGS